MASRKGWRRAGFDECVGKRFQTLAMFLVRLRLQFLHRLSYFHCSRGRRQRFAVTNGDRIKRTLRELPDEAATFEAEDASPHAIEMHGNDRRIDALS
jgi:hypothetical protein